MATEVVVGITGASGSIYAARLLRALAALPALDRVHLVVSRHARTALREELGIPAEGPLDIKRLVEGDTGRIELHPINAVDACIASGSHRTLGMVVVPCSVGTLARVAHGTSDSLLTRAADVCLKERRTLLLVVRETPLSLVSLRNMVAAAEAGATILPAMPAFYSGPRSIDEMVDHFLARVLDHLGLAHELGRRWRDGG